MPRLFPAGFVSPCQPSHAQVPPIGADWLHEIKRDGRDGNRVRLFTRNGHDWAARYPAIAAAAAALQARSFLIDGEAVVADARGVASFDLLRGRARGASVVGIRPPGARRGGPVLAAARAAQGRAQDPA